MTKAAKAAKAVPVAAQHRLPLAHAWGGGEVASADGLRVAGIAAGIKTRTWPPVEVR